MRSPIFGPGVTVLVTGASSGLGRCLGLELARRRCRLILCGRHQERLEASAAEARLGGAAKVDTVLADLSRSQGVESVLESLHDKGIAVDALVNNAGAGWAGPWSELDSQEEDRLLQLLVKTPLALTRALLPVWRAQGRGALLNVASSGAFQPGPQTAVYYAAKAFLTSWSLALAREERQWLTVTTACPGAMTTPFAERVGRRPSPGAQEPEPVARILVKAWAHGKGLVVPGAFNKILVLTSRVLGPTGSAVLVDRIQCSLRNR